MPGFFRDLLYALRLIRKSPLFSLYVIAPLALGIGLNGAIFLLLDALLLRPLPVKNPENLVRLVEVVQNLGPRSYYTYGAVEALQRKSTSFSEVIGYADDNAAVRDSSGANRVRVQIVTGNFFTALGVQPLYGRVLTPADAFESAASPPVVLSYPYWRAQFHQDPNIIGKTLTLEERSFTIVGVMPQQFNGLELETTPDIRIPLIAAGLLARNDADRDSFRKFDYSLAARLRPGVTLEQARAESFAIVNAAMDMQVATNTRDEHLEVQPIATGVSLIRPRFAGALILLMSGVGLLLLMICANVGGLLLARAAARREETAVRLAIGATTGRLLRQWLTESLVLTSIGGLAGLWIASAAAPLFVRAIPTLRDLSATALPVSLDLRPDIRVAAFAIGVCALCALFAGLPAALQATRTDLHSSLKSTRGTSRQPLRWTLVAIQVGLCTFLLAGAGLLITTFRHLRALDPGFDRDHVVTFSLDPGMAQYTPAQAADLQTRLVTAVRTLPGVESVGTALLGLMRGTGMKTTVAPEGQIAPRSDFMNTSLNAVSPDYFETMGIHFLAGRNLRPNEPQTKPEPVVVNRAFVRRFFPGTDPIGRKFGTGTGKPVPGDMQIVGVVSDAKYRSLREAIPPTIYHLQYAAIKFSNAFVLHVRTRNRPEGIIEAVRKSLNAIDPRLPFYEIHTLAEEVNSTLWAERLLAWLSAIFSGVAAVLATLGVYATLAYAITQSRREIGIRVALGAGASDVLRLFSARPVRFAALGVLLGLAGFYAARPAFRTVLYEVSPADPLTIAASAGAVLFIAMAATLVAIRSALRVDPATVLREE
ncbi:MAG TPA: ABC transporter permease [Bryobacteraceae bacterium]|nr:ABC transporter permease [Bryobacteraceae bacterium]